MHDQEREAAEIGRETNIHNYSMFVSTIERQEGEGRREGEWMDRHCIGSRRFVYKRGQEFNRKER